jgi:hypothetical protein
VITTDRNKLYDNEKSLAFKFGKYFINNLLLYTIEFPRRLHHFRICFIAEILDLYI